MFGLLTLAVGVWGVVIAVDGNYEALTGGNLISGAVLLLVAGAITVFVSIIGFCGAVGMWRSFLVIVSAFNPFSFSEFSCVTLFSFSFPYYGSPVYYISLRTPRISRRTPL